MVGGEIYVKKIPSMKITDLAETICPGRKQEIIGIRPGEKMHEQMIGCEDAPFTFEYDEHFKILPSIHNMKSISDSINYNQIIVKWMKTIMNLTKIKHFSITVHHIVLKFTSV